MACKQSKNSCVYFQQIIKKKNTKFLWEENKEQWQIVKRKTIKNLLISHFIIFPLILIIETNIGLKFKLSIQQFPSNLEILIQIFFFMICEDFGFYWSHFILHHPKLYQKYHKTHHEYNQPFSITAEYSHPLEYIFGNLLPSSLGIKILTGKVHLFTGFLWIIWRTYTTAEVHSGYEIPFSPVRVFPLSGGSYFHNFHHSNNTGSFGSYFTFWDNFMKTNKQFNNYMKNIFQKNE
ncbi:sterol desaturase family protein, putative [Ichthyophthirius multifiliis]|uniref:Sterol desaturase family protein, putative n=1 Tax=Ichthyophthirius multifiliis TaxID=5932 RepID=G0R0E1_ICHMU|nr:sterol desaturase family protein, putative [Ichthyophthirius multifiliis]EGR29078.1 sterol desaturase family protein, putative [Ichthyophthirius multifiliis]|eukprot:XP_004030314.1 sterol desaturase family protein, putative [Ichthyophthirius multifiliis]